MQCALGWGLCPSGIACLGHRAHGLKVGWPGQPKRAKGRGCPEILPMVICESSEHTGKLGFGLRATGSPRRLPLRMAAVFISRPSQNDARDSDGE